jgi:hypothetical protein
MAAKNKGGRPAALQSDDNTLEVVRGLGRIQATTKECAAVLGVSEPTFIKFKKDNPRAQEAYEQGLETGKASLRRYQFDLAKKGNATMQIWLGKQLLGQRDQKDIGGPGGGPIPVIDLSKIADMSDEELDTVERALIRLGFAGSDQGGEAKEAGEQAG